MRQLMAMVCRVLGHHDRRLRKGERTGQIDANWRICGRCGRMRTVNKRKAKV